MSKHQEIMRALSDSQYDNDLLKIIASESRTFAELVRLSIEDVEAKFDGHNAIWLGSFLENRPHTQVQLIITQKDDSKIDEG